MVNLCKGLCDNTTKMHGRKHSYGDGWKWCLVCQSGVPPHIAQGINLCHCCKAKLRYKPRGGKNRQKYNILAVRY